MQLETFLEQPRVKICSAASAYVAGALQGRGRCGRGGVVLVFPEGAHCVWRVALMIDVINFIVYEQIDSTLVWTPVHAREQQEKRALSTETETYDDTVIFPGIVEMMLRGRVNF